MAESSSQPVSNITSNASPQSPPRNSESDTGVERKIQDLDRWLEKRLAELENKKCTIVEKSRLKVEINDKYKAELERISNGTAVISKPGPLKAAFDEHRSDCERSHCVLCCRMWDLEHPPESDDPLRNYWNEVEDTAARLQKETQSSFENDFLPGECPTSFADLKTKFQPTINKFVDSLYADLCIPRHEVKKRCEVYFDYFYINFLRQVLETMQIKVDAREIYVKSEKNKSEGSGTKRKVDLIGSSNDKKRVYLVEESALGIHGTRPAKKASDRAKLAMTLYNEGRKHGSRPPLGILAHWSTEKEPSLSVFTLKQIGPAMMLTMVATFCTPFDFGSREDEPGQPFLCAVWNIVRIAIACSAASCDCSENGESQDFSDSLDGVLVRSEDGRDGAKAPQPLGDNIESGGEQVSVSTAKKPKTKQSCSISNTSEYKNCPCMLYKRGGRYKLPDEVHSAIFQVERLLDGQAFVEKNLYSNDCFATESMVLSRAKELGCSSVVQLIDVCARHRSLYLEELDDIPWKSIRTDDSLCLKACHDVTHAVSSLHKADIAHCDLSDSCILLRPSTKERVSSQDYEFVVIDYNLALMNADKSSECDVPEGTFGWSFQGAFACETTAKWNDSRTLGLILATLCTEKARELNDFDGSMYYEITLELFRDLVDPDKTEMRGIRFEICKIGYELFDMELSAEAALDRLKTLSIPEIPRRKENITNINSL